MSNNHHNTGRAALTAGINLKPEHYQDALSTEASGLWYEVHTENYFVKGGPRLQYLEAVRAQAPISFHGVGASLGSTDPVDQHHLQQVRQLVDRFEPALVSEHATWSRYQQTYYADLFPLPRSHQAMAQLVAGVQAYQEGIGRSILIENPTNYLSFISEMDEPEFLVEVAQRSGSGLLLDVNNLYLSSQNCGIDAMQYIQSIPQHLVQEIHIAGFDEDEQFGDQLLIDSHGSEVREPVWQLLQIALEHFGHTPVLLERDANLPSFKELMEERDRAEQLLQSMEVHHHVA